MSFAQSPPPPPLLVDVSMCAVRMVGLCIGDQCVLMHLLSVVELLYPPKLREDDVFGFFVRDNDITSQKFQQFERVPEELQKCISSSKYAAVLFFQPCESARGCLLLRWTPTVNSL